MGGRGGEGGEVSLTEGRFLNLSQKKMFRYHFEKSFE